MSTTAALTATDVTITGSSASYGGGVAVVVAGFGATNVAVSDCSASRQGGGLFTFDSVTVVSGGAYTRCYADESGPVFAGSGGSLAVSDLTTSESSCEIGGSVALSGTDGSFTNVAFYNAAATYGGSVFADSQASVTMYNCVMNGSASALGRDVFALYVNDVVIRRSNSTIGPVGGSGAPQAVFVLLADSVSVHDSRIASSGASTLGYELRGSTVIVIENSKFYGASGSVPLTLVGSGDVTLRDSFIGSDGVRGAINCLFSDVHTVSSVVCATGGAPMECNVCSFTGTYKKCQTDPTDRCGLECDDRNYCIDTSLGLTTVPNYGCDLCGGACWTGADSCDLSSTECEDAPNNGYACTCRTGFQTPSGDSCADVNECVAGTHTCGGTTYCVNTYGSFTCDCIPGYQKSGE